MLSLIGYDLREQVSERHDRVTWRGVRLKDGLPVLAVSHAAGRPSPSLLDRLALEHAIGSLVSHASVVRTVGLVPRRDGGVALILEDHGGVELADLPPAPAQDLDAYLHVAIQLAEGLDAIHQRHIVHRDIGPRSIWLRPETGTVHIGAFGHAARAPGQSAVSAREFDVSSASVLAYLSPEQTARMGRPLDRRSDLYSLGVTLYELLTGRRPFPNTDPMELVHAHIAREPALAHTLVPTVPPTLSAILARLLQKIPEHRYQCAYGLRWDLERLRERAEKGRAFEPMQLGERDLDDRFVVPERVDSRRELGLLWDALEGWERGGRARLVLCHGAAGMGKTAILEEIRGRLVATPVLQGAGRFDEAGHERAYSAVVAAMGGVLEQVIAAEPEVRRAAAGRLSEALGPNADVLVELLPELEALVGPRPPPQHLPPTQTANRLRIAVRGLVRAMASTRPILLFLDDLHWADAASLDLLTSLVTDPAAGRIVILGAYRATEQAEAAALQTLVEGAKGNGASVVDVSIEPLSRTQVTELVASAVRQGPREALPLAEVVFERTLGNPLFAREMLFDLRSRDLIAFSGADRRWRWDLEGIRKISSPGSVVELLGEMVTRLPEEARAAIRIAACLGHTFALGTLAVALGKPIAATAGCLGPPIELGILVALDDGHRFLQIEGLDVPAHREGVRYRFRHDRIHQAAYALIPPEELPLTHLGIGRRMLRALSNTERQARAVELVGQLNHGASMVRQADERLQLLRLNLIAARDARSSAAWEAAFGYMSVARSLLPTDASELHRELTFEVYRDHAECAFLAGRGDAGEASAEGALAQARTDPERAAVCGLRLVHYTTVGRFEEALATGLEGLRGLGVKLPDRPLADEIAHAAQRAKAALAGRSPSSLVDLPVDEDPARAQVHRLLVRMMAPAYMGGRRGLFMLLVLEHARLSLLSGNTPQSTYGYANYGSLLAHELGEPATGSEFGSLALALSERLGDREFRSATLVLYALFIQAYNAPWRTLWPTLQAAVTAGIESGDLFHAAMASFHLVQWSPQLDVPTAIEEGARYLEIIEATHAQGPLDLARLAQGMRLGLRGETDDPLSFSHGDFEEAAAIERIRRTGLTTLLAIHRIMKLQSCVIFGAWEAAADHARALDVLGDSVAGHAPGVESSFLGALALSAGAASLSDTARARLATERGRMAAWAARCPDGYIHRVRLLEAEEARLDGRFEDAARAYEESATAAGEADYPLHEALACELAGRFYMQQEMPRLAALSFAEAQGRYADWGATAKVHHMDASSGLPRESTRQPRTAVTPGAPVAENRDVLTARGSMDVLAITRASQAISSELGMPRFLSTMMTIIVETAGARRGILVLGRGDDLCVEAAAEVRQHGLDVSVLGAVPLGEAEGLCRAVVRFVSHTGREVLLADAASAGAFRGDPFVREAGTRSVLCMPVRLQERRLGVIYLANDLVPGAFEPSRVELLQLLVAQAAISLESARLYEDLVREVRERERAEAELREHRDRLEELVDERTRDLSAAHDQLVRRERLATLGQLTATVSHELRNPIGTMRLSAATIRSCLATEGPGAASALDRLDRSITRCDQTIDELLDFARITVADRSPTVLDAWIGALLDEQSLPEHVTLEWRPGLGTEEASVDTRRLRRAMINLIDNACDALRETGGGVVTITTRRSGDRVEIDVEDTGPGIAPEVLPHIFEPLFSTKTFGVGLGMPTVQQIMVAHGGDVDVHCEPHGGTRMRLWFMDPPSDLT